MTKSTQMNCLLLCGGKGTRMQSETKHKVCFEIDGKPSILHTLSNFKKAGTGKFIVVVGALAGQVMECIAGKYPDTDFAFQKEQKGTGNAAKIGFCHMGKLNIDGPVIITMGDKIISPAFIKRAVKNFRESGADLLVSVQPKAVNPTGGRIVMNKNDKPIGNREELDTKKAMLYKELYKLFKQGFSKTVILEKLEHYANKLILSNKKRVLALEELSKLDFEDSCKLKRIVRERSMLTIGEQEFDPEDVDSSKYTNASFYIMSGRAAKYALPLIGDDNAQKEEYLTDIIEIIASHGGFKLELEPVRDEYEIMSFNNVEELLKVEDYYRRRKADAAMLPQNNMYKPVGEWIHLFEKEDKQLNACLREIYGSDASLLAERKQTYTDVLKLFADQYGSQRKVVLSRAPGRINLMGRHIDHRGGNINVMSISKEVIIVAAQRADDMICISNTDEAFEERNFNISKHFMDLDWDSWLSYLESKEIEKLINNDKGNWVNYVKAPVLRLQYRFRDRMLRGMDMAFTGNIPLAAGLSSSSAIVVATAEAFCALNALDLTPGDFVELCGEGEWYAGCRGGAGDHAAMKFAQRGQVVKLGFLPFEFDSMFRFPEGYKMIIANSFMKANKTTNAKDAYNSRVSAFDFGVMIFKDKFAQYSDLVEHLRDINTEKLGLSQKNIFEILLELPEEVKPTQLHTVISEENHAKIKSILASHTPPDSYLIRQIVLYGIAECKRAALCKELFDEKRIEEFGRLMNISHDGDRVVRYDEKGNPQPYDSTLTDAKLHKLIADIKSKCPAKALSARIENQPGGYACSIPEIDFLVDTALKIDGVIGAQISGAGLGGCVMIMVRDDSVSALITQLEKEYYKPRGLKSGLTVCVAVNGSGVLSL